MTAELRPWQDDLMRDVRFWWRTFARSFRSWQAWALTASAVAVCFLAAAAWSKP